MFSIGKNWILNTLEILYTPQCLALGKVLNIYVMLCAIWYHLYNFKNTHGVVLLLVKLQAKCYF